jgi:hypothetical protein
MSSANRKLRPKWARRIPDSRRSTTEKPWYKRTITWVGTAVGTPVLVAAVVGIVVPRTQKLVGANPSSARPTRPSSVSPSSVAPVKPDIRVSVEHDRNKVESFSDIGANDYLIPRGHSIGAYSDNEPFYVFATRLGGVPVNAAYMGVTTQNLSGGAVYLKDMRVVNLKCGPHLWRHGERRSFGSAEHGSCLSWSWASQLQFPLRTPALLRMVFHSRQSSVRLIGRPFSWQKTRSWSSPAAGHGPFEELLLLARFEQGPDDAGFEIDVRPAQAERLALSGTTHFRDLLR